MLKRLLYPVCTLVLWAVAGYLALGGIGEPPSASHQEPVHHETTEHHKAPAPPKSLYERATFRQDYTVVSVDKPGPEYAAVSLVTEPTHDKGALAFMAKEQALQHEVNNAFVLAFSSEKAARSDNTAPFAAVQIDIPNEKAAVTFF
jgi:hypothetical protein